MQKHLRAISKPSLANDDLQDLLTFLTTLLLPILEAVNAFMEILALDEKQTEE